MNPRKFLSNRRGPNDCSGMSDRESIEAAAPPRAPVPLHHEHLLKPFLPDPLQKVHASVGCSLLVFGRAEAASAMTPWPASVRLDAMIAKVARN